MHIYIYLHTYAYAFTCTRTHMRMHDTVQTLKHFRKKLQLPLAIVHPLCGSMHVVRPSVVPSLIRVSPRPSPQSSDSSRILSCPPFGISRSKNQFMPISACTSRSCRSRGSSTASGLEGASHYIRRFTCAGPFLLHTFPR